LTFLKFFFQGGKPKSATSPLSQHELAWLRRCSPIPQRFCVVGFFLSLSGVKQNNYQSCKENLCYSAVSRDSLLYGSHPLLCSCEVTQASAAEYVFISACFPQAEHRRVITSFHIRGFTPFLSGDREITKGNELPSKVLNVIATERGLSRFLKMQ